MNSDSHPSGAGNHPLLGVGQLVVFDLETTGLRAKSDEIIQISATRLEGWSMTAVDSFTTFVDPGRPIPELARRITNITDVDVAGAPSPKEALAAFAKFCDGSVLFGHDIYRFDFGFIKKHLGVAGGRNLPIRFMDTMDIFELLWPDFSRLKHGLDEIALRLEAGIGGLERHRADGDTLLLARIFQRIQTIPDMEWLAALVPIHRGELPAFPADPLVN